MARRLRCPCGNIVTLPEADAVSRVSCPACKKVLSVPAAKEPATAVQSKATNRPTGVAPAAAPRPVATPTPKRPKAVVAPSNRWKWVSALGVLLLAGGGTAAWMHYKDRPKPVENRSVEVAPGKPSDKKDDSKHNELPAPPPPYQLTAALERPEASPGSKANLNVSIIRGPAFMGDVALSLDGLPPGVTATVPNLAASQNAAVVPLILAPGVQPGRYAIRAIGTAKEPGKEVPVIAPAVDLVLVAPFELKIEPASVKLAQGGKTTLTVTALRKGGYEGPVALEVRGLPSGVTAPKPQIAVGQTSATVDLTAAADALLGMRPDVLVAGTIPEAAAQTIQTHKLAVEVTTARPPFDLVLDPTLLKVPQGGKATVKATVTRREYAGPIAVELRNLSNKFDAQKGVIPAGQTSVDLEVAAAADAPPKDTTNVIAVGTTTETVPRQITSGAITVRVTTLFQLVVDPTRVPITQGGKATIMLTASRMEYGGPIDIELRNLPAGVTAAKALLGKDETQIKIELTATDKATLGDKNDVTAVGTALDANKRQILSDPFVVAVGSATPFDLTVDAAPYRLRRGDKITVRVTATRRDYDGPINIELRNLPALVTAPKGTIPQGKNSVDLELTADPDARSGDRLDVRAVGTTVALGDKEITTVPFLVGVRGKPSFDLKLSASSVVIRHNGTASIRVSAARKFFDGPIDVVLQGLPVGVSAAKVTLARGQNDVALVLKAQGNAAAGDTTGVLAVGTASGITAVNSPGFTVTVRPAPPVPVFDLKAEPASVKLHAGGKAKVKVVVARKNYDGPITVELRNLPANVTATRPTIAKGKNSVEIELSAAPKMAPIEKGDIHVHGTAENHSIDSPAFKVHVIKK